MNWLPVDALTISGYARRLVLDLPLDFLKISKSISGNVVKLCPFVLL